MKTEIVKYGLLHIPSKKIVTYYGSNNGDDYEGVSRSIILDLNSDDLWLVDDKLTAAWVKRNSTERYNADMDTPSHNFKENELKVVKVTQIVETTDEDCDLIPDTKFFKMKYGGGKFSSENNPGHLAMLLKYIENGEDVKACLWDYKNMIYSHPEAERELLIYRAK